MSLSKVFRSFAPACRAHDGHGASNKSFALHFILRITFELWIGGLGGCIGIVVCCSTIVARTALERARALNNAWRYHHTALASVHRLCTHGASAAEDVDLKK